MSPNQLKTYPGTIFVGNRCLGVGNFPPDIRTGECLRSAAYFCDECGEIWARIVYPGMKFQTYSLLCDRHVPRFYFEVPGSLWLSCEHERNMGLPPAVWEREFTLHLRQYDHYNDRS